MAKTVSELMSRDVRTVRPEDTILTAAKLMGELDVGSLPVWDGERLVGMVTDRDIAVRGAGNGLSPESAEVSQVMSQDVECCRDTDSVDAAAAMMGEHQVRRLPVLDKSDRLVGILALGDVATKGAEDNAGEALTDISEAPRS